jgi:membrane associated rhomboid family serine protease
MSFNHNYGGGRQITPVVRDLLIINVLFFIGTSFNQPIANALSLYNADSALFRPYQLVTHFFMHGNVRHLVFNALGLFSIGVTIEMVWGGRRFLTYFLLCGLGAALIHLLMAFWESYQIESALAAYNATPDTDTLYKVLEYCYRGVLKTKNIPVEILDQMSAIPKESVIEQVSKIIEMKKNIPMVGASGAIYGLFIAGFWLFPESAISMLFIPFPIKVKYIVPIMLFSDLYMGFNHFPGDNVAHFAHLGGALIGAIILFFWYNKSITR